jgi:hypothetical protein
VDGSDCESLAELAGKVLREITAWTADYPIMGDDQCANSRAEWISLQQANSFPAAPLSLLVDTSALILAIFSYDDILDGVYTGRSYAELAAFSMRCRALVDGPAAPVEVGEIRRADPEGQVLAAYQDCFQRIRSYPAYSWAPGGPGELHPRAPTERNVTVSRHSALLI